MSFLKVKNISYTYKDSLKPALSDVSFKLKKNEYLAILGANGSGKSTLVRCIAGLLNPSEGSIRLNHKVDFFTLQEKKQRKKSPFPTSVPTAMVFQFPSDQIIGETIGQDIAFGPENLGLPFNEIKTRVNSSAKRFNFYKTQSNLSQKLTTGQKQRLALASANSLNPTLLLLDEPTSMLSQKAKTELLDFLELYKKEGATIIHITHNLDEAKKASRVLVLDDGKLVFDGSPSQLCELPKEKLIKLGLAYKYKKAQKNLSQKNEFCELYPGKLIMITGESGSGKSYILELLAGLAKTKEGYGYESKNRTRALAVQEVEASLFSEFLADDISYGPKNLGLSGKPLVERVYSSMEKIGLPQKIYKDRRTFSLSGGEKRKVGLAGILAMDSEIILLDEPSSGLDVKSRGNLIDVLFDLKESGKTIICTTNKKDELEFADKIIDLKENIRTEFAEAQAELIAKDLGFTKINIKENKSNKDLKTIEKLNRGSQGSYKNLNTAIHNLSPVSKYLFTICWLSLALASKSLCFLVGLLIAECVPVMLSKLSLKRLAKSFFFVLPWLVLFSLIQIKINPNDLITPIMFILRFLALLIPLSIFVFTSSLSEIMYGFEDLFSPLKIIGVPVQDIAFVVGMVFRFMGLLYTEASKISLARFIRGAGNKKERGLMKKIRSLVSLFVPLMIRTLVRADRLSQAVVARYFGVTKRTRYYDKKMHLGEKIFIVFFVLICIGILVLSKMEKSWITNIINN